MAEVLALYMGKPPPEDRALSLMALDLVHAAGTGEFPFAGGLRDQPRGVQDGYRLVLKCRIEMGRARLG